MTSPRLIGHHHHKQSNIDGLTEALVGLTSGVALDGIFPWPQPVLETLTGLTDGAMVDFPTLNYFVDGTTRVFVEGLLIEADLGWTEDADLAGVTLTTILPAGTRLEIEYWAQIA